MILLLNCCHSQITLTLKVLMATAADVILIFLLPASVDQSDARLTGDQEVACLTPAGLPTFFRGD